MRRNELGASSLDVSVIGIGTWAMGGSGWGFAWGEQNDEASIASMAAALDAGVNWIDTAPVYGLGHAEEIVGRALRGMRDRPYIFTKCGLVWDEQGRVEHRLTRESIHAEANTSLSRLGVEAIDLYQIHWPLPRFELGEALEAMVELREAGKIKHIGVSNFNDEDLRQAAGVAVSTQTMYSLVNRAAETSVFPVCQEFGLATLTYSPMMSGLLTGRMTRERLVGMPRDDWRRSHPEFCEPRLTQNLELAELLGGLGRERDVSAGTIAVAWCLQHPQTTGVVVGARSPEQVEEWARCADIVLSDVELAEIHQMLSTIEPLAGENHARAFRGELTVAEPRYLK